MKHTILAAGAVLALSSGFTAQAAEQEKPQFVSDWWHQSVNVVGSYHTRFGPALRNDTYLEYEAFAKKDWFDFYGYVDAPRFFGGYGFGFTDDFGGNTDICIIAMCVFLNLHK